MKKTFVFWASCLLFISPYSAQRIRQCKADEECILINECPAHVKLLRSSDTNSIQKLRNSICDFKSRRPLVCCPSMTTRIGLPKPSGRDKLPKQCGRPIIQDRIFGGVPTALGAYPWLVALGYTAPGSNGISYECGGSIITANYILTAGHCVSRTHLGRRRLSNVYIGAWDLTTSRDCIMVRGRERCYTHVSIAVEKVIIHPEFDIQAESAYDIALIKLMNSINFDSPNMLVEPVCLPTNNLNVRSFVGNRKPVAAGWGLTQHGNTSNVIMSVKLPLVEDDQCRKIFLSRFIGKQLCVGGERGMDTCMGDSGGPLVLSEIDGPPYTQIGIVSFGIEPCGDEKRPGVYSSVSDYVPWILEMIEV